MPRPLPLRRIVKPCHFRHLPSHLPPIFSTLARPSLNPFPCYLFPPAGGRVPLVYPERARRVNQPRLLTVHCRLLTFRESLATSSISFISPPYEHQPRISLVSPTYAKTGGWVPPQKCRRADIFDFSPDFSHFPIARHLPASEGGRCTRAEPIPLQRKPRSTGRASPFAGRRSLGTGHRPLLRSPCRFHHHSTPRLLRQAFPKRNLSESRQVPGARPAGMPAIAYRCPDAHD